MQYPEDVSATIVYEDYPRPEQEPIKRWVILRLKDGALVVPNPRTNKCDPWNPGDKWKAAREVPGEHFERVFTELL